MNAAELKIADPKRFDQYCESNDITFETEEEEYETDH